MEIKSHTGKILFKSTKTTVREMVIEAVKEGADLQGADLRGADLQGAYLWGADLRGADLQGAYLWGAYLRGAYLWGADLRGAYLRGAYLQGADLQGADLQGAYLRGAYLRGADLQGADLQGAYLQGAYLQGAYLRGADGESMWVEVATALREALKAMNDSGRHWIKGSLNQTLPYGSTAYCSIGGVEDKSEGTVRTLALWLLGSVAGGDIAAFNDWDGTTWEDVQAVFAIAIRHAERLARS